LRHGGSRDEKNGGDQSSEEPLHDPRMPPIAREQIDETQPSLASRADPAAWNPIDIRQCASLPRV
jgi:hypothetical protein